MSAAEETIKAPPSRVPKAALLNRIIGWVSSVRFGVALLCILVVLSMVGMLIIQQNVNGFDSYYASLTPAEKTIYGALGLFDIYHSWYFNLMLLVLSLNIVLASIDRFPSAWSYIVKPKLTATRKWLEAKKLTQTRRFDGKAPQAVAEEIAAVFKSKGLKPTITEAKDATFVLGESGKWNRLGAYVVHVALITLFMGHWVALQTGFDADVRMVPGQKTEQIQLIEYNLDKKERYNVQLPFSITCTDIQQQLIDEAGAIDVQNTLDWRTEVRIADPAYGTYTANVSLNKPLNYRGYRFFQAQSIPIGNARMVTLNLTPENGGPVESIKIQRDGFTTLADGTKVEYADFQPDFTIGPNGQPDTRSSEYKNPVAILNVTPPNGESTRVFAFAREIGGKHYANMAGLVLAESYLSQGGVEECENSLRVIEDNDPSADFFVLGNIQRIRGLAALADGDNELAIHHFSRSLTIFEAAEDLYHTGLLHYLLGVNLDEDHAERARKSLNTAADIFRKLGIRSYTDAIGKELVRVESSKAPKPAGVTSKRANSVVSQLLTVRLAEAAASRELLFRELVAVLQQESNAKKIIIADVNDQKRLYPFITHGYSPIESNELVGKLTDAQNKNDEKTFARTKNIAVLPLRGSAAAPAFLVIHPASGAMLNDESSLAPLLRVVELGMDVVALRERDKSTPTEQDASPYTSNSLMPGFIHSSPAMTALVEEVYKIRSSDVTVLVTGESGTGKELVSRAIHTLSNRKDKIFVPFNCTAVPKELAEGHLFGYKKGAFTGAVQDSPGTIRTADGGTLFLDEVGDLPLDVQPKLLRFLQEGEIQPLGDKRPLKVDVRIIAATNMPLEEKVADGTFREDLYYRLNVIRLRVPPLRERRSEIPPIVNYYINHYSARFNKRNITFTPQTIDLLMVCSWDGNVRQLCNEVQRVIARAVDNEVITPEHLSPELKRSSQPLTPFGNTDNARPIATYDGSFSPFTNIAEGGTLEDAVTELEMQLIRASLIRHSWNISRVAGELGLTRRGLYLKLSRYGIAKAA